MAGKHRDKSIEEFQRPISPSKKYFFLDGKLVKKISQNRGANIVYLYNLTDVKNQTMLLSDFKKHSKRAYSVKNSAKILNRSHMQLHRYAATGLIDPPMGALPNGERAWQRLSFYSEDDIFKIREAMTTISRGRTRKDGTIVNNTVLTEQEVRARMGDALMLYTQTKDGRFVPVWAEETY